MGRSMYAGIGLPSDRQRSQMRERSSGGNESSGEPVSNVSWAFAAADRALFAAQLA